MKKNWIERGREVLDIEIEALASVRERIGPAFSEAVELMAACPGRVAVTGIGKSGLVGRKIAATLSSTGTPSFFLHPVEGAHGDLGVVRNGDVVIAISNSGKTDELNAILPALRSLGASIVAITAGLDSTLARLSDIVLDAGIPREACPMNLAPTSSTTAALALGDALAVCLIEHNSFTAADFKRFHPGGALGLRLSLGVADLMHRAAPRVMPGTSLANAVAELDAAGFGAVIVTEKDGELAGILTDGDLRRLICRSANLDEIMKKPVEAVMTQNPLHGLESMSAAELVDIMEQTSITVLPVLDGNGLVSGIVHMHDLLGKGQVKFAGLAGTAGR